MHDLQVISAKFKEWRGNRRYHRYPKHFWDEIQKLSQYYSIPAIANAFGINVQYLRKKILNAQELTFAPLKVASMPSTISIEFIDRNSREMTVRFQADFDQLIHIIQSLSDKSL